MPTPAPGAALYRSDGACRGQGGWGDHVAGGGAAVWAPTVAGRGDGEPMATVRGALGHATNNVAEYHGLLACMAPAQRTRDPSAVFEVDSLLVARQMAHSHPWTCCSAALVDLHKQCVRVGEFLTQRDINWNVRHIYREYNQVADSLANQAIDEPDTNVPSDLSSRLIYHCDLIHFQINFRLLALSPSGSERSMAVVCGKTI